VCRSGAVSVTTASVRFVAISTSKTVRPPRASYKCVECGWGTAKWVGRCGECQAWGTMVDAAAPTSGPRTSAATSLRRPAQPIGDIDIETARARSTGVPEFDRVLGGGLVPGAVVLVAGEPGAGKSTLLLDVAARAAQRGQTVLYVTGEESAGQVRLRAERIGALAPRLLLAAETDLSAVLAQVERAAPALLVVDSVQTIASAEVDGTAGGVSQIREVAAALIAVSKERSMSTLLVGHVTKDGSLAGPRVLEHLVDVVCQFEGERHTRLRLLRAVKNRYGPTDEVGCFDLTETGIQGLADPSGLFLSHESSRVPGTCVTITLEGRRPLATEIQALVAGSPLANPRRTTSGVDSSRLAMVLAVLQRRLSARLADQDVYVSTIGGARAGEPAADLALALAVVSSRENLALRPRLVALGEVGLAGEIRPVSGLARRLSEAARLGFTTAVVPRHPVDRPVAPAGMQLIEVADLAEAVARSREPQVRTS